MRKVHPDTDGKVSSDGKNVAAEMNAEADRQEIAEKALSKAMKAGKSSKKLIPKYVLSKDSPNPPEIYSVRYSPDSELLAATHADGFLRVYHGATGKERYVMQCGGHDHMPVLCCRWRPSMGNKTKNVLLVGTGEGHIQHWHVTSSKLLSDSWLEDETIYAYLGTGYDEAGELCALEDTGGGTVPGQGTLALLCPVLE
eukprot:Cvel_19841.t1-p1 / transcript=Cvel_19841.t1 / gene=Cvel_19841 / organism=Chromera_velia_CCMP2878 / gene_product=hypothetical protein / transcript_product=hypothetical protein / location=Cvel_scaffold1737:7222-12653(-) / protein_length=197 / sequence_SO=supercontig / SO=protein_coding / is_pseudo=false